MTTYLVDGEPFAAEDARAYAEERLGRPLTDGERALDLVGLDLDLAEGKEALTAAIEAAKRDAIERRLAGEPASIEMTPEIEEAIAGLIRAGRKHARDEILRLTGVDVSGRRFVEGGAGWLDRLLGNLISYLAAIRVRVNNEAGAAEFRGESRITEELLDRLDERVPGARDAASRIVSGLLIGALGEVYEENADLFPCFIYSAVMDGATCRVCREFDGTRYETWAEGETHLPNGGPNPLCLGDGRCRCRLVPCAPGERVGDVEPEPEPVSEEIDLLRRATDEFAGLSDEEFVALEANDPDRAVFNVAGGPSRELQGRVDELKAIGRGVEDEANRRYREGGYEQASEEAFAEEEERRERIREMFNERSILYETIESELLDEFPDDDPDTRDRMIRRDERWQDLQTRIARAQDDQLRLLRENETRFDPLRIMSELRREVLSEIRSMGGTFNRRRPDDLAAPRGEGYRNFRDPSLYDLADDQARFLPTDWIDRSNARNAINVAERDRGHYRDGTAMVAISGREPDDRASTMLHELGHRMEYSVPEVRLWEWAFMWMRQEASHANGTYRRDRLVNLRPGSSYDYDEWAEPDDFVDPYTGRDYGRDPLDSTEVTTMGLQGLFHGDPIDDDHRDFVLGLLATVRFGA